MSANKYLEVLTPQNSQIIFIDQQPQMAFGVQSVSYTHLDVYKRQDIHGAY